MAKQAAMRTSKSASRQRARAGSKSVGKTPAGGALAQLQKKAEQSKSVNALNALQRKGSPLAQREVDTSSSPFLPDYDENEKPGWEDEQGVPDWAKEQYKAEAQTTLICSMKDGKIGSIYFPTGRIRTTHKSGPEHEPDKNDRTIQRYNLKLYIAQGIFDSKNTKLYSKLYKKTDKSLTKKERKKAAKKAYDRAFKRWLSKALLATPDNKLPSWIQRVTGSDTAHDNQTGAPQDGMKLFEVFKKVSNGKVAGWHPSRGVATKFETNKQVVSVLEVAIKHIEGVKDVNERNSKFYEFILHRIPDFAKLIRKPDEI